MTRQGLENDCLAILVAVQDAHVADKFASFDQVKVVNQANFCLSWLEVNGDAPEDEVVAQQQLLAAVASPAFKKVYKVANKKVCNKIPIPTLHPCLRSRLPLDHVFPDAQERVQAKLQLEYFCNAMAEFLHEELSGCTRACGAGDRAVRELVEKALQETLEWLCQNKFADAEAFVNKFLDVEEDVWPVMLEAWRQAGRA